MNQPSSSGGPLASLHAMVRGYVQGVGFRYFVQGKARELGLGGYVRNLPDGESVEVYAEGSRDRLQRLLMLLWTGPDNAQVSDIDVTWGQPSAKPLTFEIRH